MNISLQSFAKQLKANKVPFYAYPKYEPTEVFERYKFGVITGVRNPITINGNRNISKEIYRLDKRVQERIWNKLVKPNNEISPYIIAISSSINDYLAHEVSASLLLSILRNFRGNRKPTWSWFTPKWEPYKFGGNTPRPDIVLIRSVIPIRERLYEIRDILDYYYNSMRIVVLGGTNGIDFFDNYLYHPLNGALHIEGYKGKAPKEFWVKDEKNQVLDNDEFKYPIFTNDREGKTILQKFRVPELEEKNEEE